MSFVVSVNGKQHVIPSEHGGKKLLDFLQNDLNLTGTKLCCGIGICRACTVKVVKNHSTDAPEPVIACSTALSTLDNCEVTTIEGVANGDTLDPIQTAFLKHFSFQCGYCTPGFVMASKVFLDWLAVSPQGEEGLDDAIKEAIGPHICRCTGYVRYYEALREVALDVIAQRGQG